MITHIMRNRPFVTGQLLQLHNHFVGDELPQILRFSIASMSSMVTTFFRGQYLSVCAESPVAPHVGHT